MIDKFGHINLYGHKGHGAYKQLIIAYHGMFKPKTIAEKIGCTRCYVYLVFQQLGLDPKIETKE